MKKIFGYLRDYYETEFNTKVFILFLLFLGVCVWFNYEFNFDREIMGAYAGKWIQLPMQFVFYALPWFFVIFIQSLFNKNWHWFRSPGFWLSALVALVLVSVVAWFPYHQYIVMKSMNQKLWYWAIKITWNLKSSLIYFGCLILFYFLYDKRNLSNFYGLSTRGFDPKPYLIMLGLMLPLIIWASFQGDFLSVYPTYRPGRAEKWFSENGYHIPDFLVWFIYELVYGLDFTSIELFFRGFLVIGFIKYLGKSAILPMAAMYCFLHFGKPMMEAVSSIFGGMLLGIIAYYSKSILGGVMIHMGIAWLMDWTAYLQKYVFTD